MSLVVFSLFFLCSFTNIKDFYNRSSFECGFTPYHFSRYSFSIHYFFFSIIFLFLDLEISLIFFFFFFDLLFLVLFMFLFLFFCCFLDFIMSGLEDLLIDLIRLLLIFKTRLDFLHKSYFIFVCFRLILNFELRFGFTPL